MDKIFLGFEFRYTYIDNILILMKGDDLNITLKYTFSLQTKEEFHHL